ncbi:MAG: twin-arginine translocation signal domain-containing protein, partial [Bacteroidales bacterium]|nr:twin-arginine translocation signal domain-containing protein [Bacteroidales bacterium]
MSNEHPISRRGFLKTAAAIGAALTIGPAFEKVQAAKPLLD